jgi:hypothetical protein
MPTSKPATPAPEPKAEQAPEMVEVRTFGMVDVYEDGDIRVDRESGEVPADTVDAFIRKAGMHGVHVMELKKEE